MPIVLKKRSGIFGLLGASDFIRLLACVVKRRIYIAPFALFGILVVFLVLLAGRFLVLRRVLPLF